MPNPFIDRKGIQHSKDDMTISYKFLILPTEETTHKLLEALDTCRWLYNELLERVKLAAAHPTASSGACKTPPHKK
jgi:hypothetical protein